MKVQYFIELGKGAVKVFAVGLVPIVEGFSLIMINDANIFQLFLLVESDRIFDHGNRLLAGTPGSLFL